MREEGPCPRESSSASYRYLKLLYAPGSVREGRADVFLLEIRVSFKNVFVRMAGSEQAKYGPDGDSDTPNAGLTSHHLGIKSYAVEDWHGTSSLREEEYITEAAEGGGRHH